MSIREITMRYHTCPECGEQNEVECHACSRCGFPFHPTAEPLSPMTPLGRLSAETAAIFRTTFNWIRRLIIYWYLRRRTRGCRRRLARAELHWGEQLHREQRGSETVRQEI